MIKNILILEDSSKAKFGGGQKVTLEVMKTLSKEFHIILIDCKKESIFKQKAQKYIKNYFFISCYGKVVGGETSAFSIGLKELLISPFLYIKNLFQILSFLKINNYNSNNTIIYATTKKQLLLAFLLKKLLSFKYIYHAHAYDDKKSLFYKLIYPAHKNSNNIICVSNLIKNNINLPNCQTIYNPISIIDTNHKNISNKSKIIVASFSTLIKLKGIEYFMQSFQYLKNKNKVEYWIFGEGQEKKYLQQFEKDNIILKGFANNSEELMLNKIDIIVVPSITEEACPMVPLEAFKYGVPVISTNIGGQAEIVKDGEVGLLVDIKNPEQIAKKIDYLVENPQYYELLSKNAIRYSKKYDIRKYREKILKVFKNDN
jgi:glycosyltransferase involved in cell wall biosynthesis